VTFMKLCIQTGGIIEAFGFEKGLEAIKDAGFDSIDWGFGHALNQSNFYHDTYRGSCIFEKGLDEVVYFDHASNASFTMAASSSGVAPRYFSSAAISRICDSNSLRRTSSAS